MAEQPKSSAPNPATPPAWQNSIFCPWCKHENPKLMMRFQGIPNCGIFCSFGCGDCQKWISTQIVQLYQLPPGMEGFALPADKVPS
jgi:hypothetical protein